MDVKFVASVAVITPNPAESRPLYRDALGLPLGSPDADDYVFTDKLDGTKHFGVWPLAAAARACFGTPEWPADRPVPQMSIEFEVAEAAAIGPAIDELAARGYDVLHGAKTEPWGQMVARIQTPEGVILGISYMPSMHEIGH